MLFWLRFITKYCYRLQKEYGNVVSPRSVLDLFKHCHKRHWIQSTREASPAFMTGRARCFHRGTLCQPGKDQTHAPMFSYLYHTRATGSNRPQSYLCTGCKQPLLWALRARIGQGRNSGPHRLGRLCLGTLTVTDVPLPWLGPAVGGSAVLWEKCPQPHFHRKANKKAHLLVAPLLAKAAELS